MERNVGRELSASLATLGRFSVAHCPFALLESSLVDALHTAGIAVHAANCNDAASLRTAFALGVEQISTCEVELAVRIRAEKQILSAQMYQQNTAEA